MKTVGKGLSRLGLLMGLLVVAVSSLQAQESQAKKRHDHQDCAGNCFSAEVVSSRPTGADCKEYELKISHDGTCRYELSHFVIEILCGKLMNVSNSYGCREVIGKDPTTGITGLKFDDVRNFGKGDRKSLLVRFTLCGDASCHESCWQPRVAFKAATCVDIDTARATCTSDQALKASVTSKNASCAGSSDGALAVNVEGGKGPYTYLWSTGCDAPSIGNLPAGTYTITVKDAAGNQVMVTATIESSAQITLTATTVNPTCSGDANGSITLQVMGGKAPYTFLWNNGSAAQNLTGLSAGLYSVTVTDASGCTSKGEWQISNPAMLLSAQLVQPACASRNGSIDLSVSGGLAPYIFQWTTGATSEDLTGVGAGTYRVVVTDANSCSMTGTYTLRENNSLRVTSTVKPTSCLDDHSGAVDVTVSGGTAPYTFLWANGSTTEDLTGLAAGIYRLTVTDAIGCTATAIASVFRKAFAVETQVTSPSCSGLANGSITVSPVEGVAPYSYLWSNGQTGNSIHNLGAGLYTVAVTDATGCSQQLSFFLSDPNIIATAQVNNLACGAEGAYSIDLSVTGGKAPYSFIWSTGAVTEDISGLTTGTYHVEITDASGCHQTADVTVNPSSAGWSCLITPPAVNPACGTTGNQLSTAVTGAAQYVWSVESADNGWAITAGGGSSMITYTAGMTGTQGIFTLSITKDGCVQTCTYIVSACTSSMTCGGTVPPPPAPTPPPDPGDPATSVEEFQLAVYPNPVQDRVHFEWTAEADEYVRVHIVDLYGRQITELYSAFVKKGERYSLECSSDVLKDPVNIFCFTSANRKVYGKLIRSRD